MKNIEEKLEDGLVFLMLLGTFALPVGALYCGLDSKNIKKEVPSYEINKVEQNENNPEEFKLYENQSGSGYQKNIK